MTKRLIDLDDEPLARAQAERTPVGCRTPFAPRCDRPRVRRRVRGRSRGCVRVPWRRWRIPTSGPTCGVIARFLIDTSAAARMRLPVVAERLEPLITGGLVATCAALDAEALHSARSPAEYEQVRSDRRDAFEYLPTDDIHWQRRLRCSALLGSDRTAPSGRHRRSLTAVLAAEHGRRSCTTTVTSRSRPRYSTSNTAGWCREVPCSRRRLPRARPSATRT